MFVFEAMNASNLILERYLQFPLPKKSPVYCSLAMNASNLLLERYLQFPLPKTSPVYCSLAMNASNLILERYLQFPLPKEIACLLFTGHERFKFDIRTLLTIPSPQRNRLYTVHWP